MSITKLRIATNNAAFEPTLSISGLHVSISETKLYINTTTVTIDSLEFDIKPSDFNKYIYVVLARHGCNKYEYKYHLILQDPRVLQPMDVKSSQDVEPLFQIISGKINEDGSSIDVELRQFYKISK